MKKNSLKKITYYPSSDDEIWNLEVTRLMPYLDHVPPNKKGKRPSKGADIGCGTRSIFKSDITVDIDNQHKPDVVASGDKLPFNTGSMDYIYGIHIIEHFKNPAKALKEWARVLHVGGICALIVPDVRFTGPAYNKRGGYKPGDPMLHHREFTQAEFEKWLALIPNLRLRLIDIGNGAPQWSFYVILEKI